MSEISLQKTDSQQKNPHLVLTADEEQNVQKLAAEIDLSNPGQITSFGSRISAEASQLTDELLTRIRSNDQDVIGDRLNDVVRLARETHSNLNFANKSWKQRALEHTINTPIIGALVKRGTRHLQKVSDGYHSASHQISAILEELDSASDSLDQTNTTLDQMFTEVTDQYRLLEIHIRAANIAIAEKEEYLQQLGIPEESDPITQQRMIDARSAISLMQKRVSDLTVLQQSCLQSLPSIRMLQANNRQIIEKFHTVREVTIPVWKQGFVIRGALAQQKNAVSLANAIDEATNQLLLQNAQLLHDNSVNTARANQRLVIDPETLKKTSDLIFKTVIEVNHIRSEGKKQREQDLLELEKIRSQTTCFADLNKSSNSSIPKLH